MKTPDGYQSDNLNDQRNGNSAQTFGSNSTASMIPLIMTLFSSKKGKFVAAILIVVMLFGGSKFTSVIGDSSNNSPFSQIDNQYTNFDSPNNYQLENSQAVPDARLSFVGFVLDDTNNFWKETFEESNRKYDSSQLVIFDGKVSTACGIESSESGPFYCPGDSDTYLDLSFFEELSTRFGASGDFASAYVIAHEIGHHVQNELGISKQAKNLVKEKDVSNNEVSVRVELQADCFAGIWANSANERGLLEVGDVDEALNAASNIGDDTLQKQAGIEVDHESFTHGTSQQRKTWFKRGFDSGDTAKCNTFSNDI